jgi:hypothetical protein
MGRLSKWYYNSGCEFPSPSVCRAILIAVVLCVLHSVGILISIYFLLTRYLFLWRYHGQGDQMSL